MLRRAQSPEPFATFAALFDACRRHRLRVYLHHACDPEGLNPSKETYLPAAPIFDPFVASHDPDRPPAAQRERRLTLFVEVRDGESLACSGDLGDALKGPRAVRELDRMCRVLVAQDRVRQRDLPHLRVDP